MNSRLDLENSKQSIFSPSIVENQENITRLSYASEHFRDGKLIETAISSDDLKRRGVSVNRESFTKQNTLAELALSQIQKSPENRITTFISKFEVLEIRGLNFPDNTRAAIIVDDGIEHNHAHAIILDAYDRPKSQIRELKNMILPILQRTLTTMKF